MEDCQLLCQAAVFAAEHYVRSGMKVGLPDHSLTDKILERLAARAADGQLHDVSVIPPSLRIAHMTRARTIETTSLEAVAHPDLYIGFVDQIDSDLNCIISSEGSILREKILAKAARTVLLVAEEALHVTELGTGASVPFEVVSFGGNLYPEWLGTLGCKPGLRLGPEGLPYTTEAGNWIYECYFATGVPFARILDMDDRVKEMPGIIAHGLLYNHGYYHRAVTSAMDSGVQEIVLDVD